MPSVRRARQALAGAHLSGELGRLADRGRTWDCLETGYAGSLWTGMALQDGSLLVAGLRGTIYRSQDDGRTWHSVDSGTKSAFTDIAEQGSRVTLVGLDGVQAISTDGGVSFKPSQRDDRVAQTAVLPVGTSQTVDTVSIRALFVSDEGLAQMLDEAERNGVATPKGMELRRGPDTFWASVQLRCLPDDSLARGNDYLITLVDVEDRRRREEAMRLDAATDPLTGLANRREFFAYAEKLTEHGQRQSLSCAVLAIDVDKFKAVSRAWRVISGPDCVLEP